MAFAAVPDATVKTRTSCSNISLKRSSSFFDHSSSPYARADAAAFTSIKACNISGAIAALLSERKFIDRYSRSKALFILAALLHEKFDESCLKPARSRPSQTLTLQHLARLKRN